MLTPEGPSAIAGAARARGARQRSASPRSVLTQHPELHIQTLAFGEPESLLEFTAPETPGLVSLHSEPLCLRPHVFTTRHMCEPRGRLVTTESKPSSGQRKRMPQAPQAHVRKPRSAQLRVLDLPPSSRGSSSRSAPRAEPCNSLPSSHVTPDTQDGKRWTPPAYLNGTAPVTKLIRLANDQENKIYKLTSLF